MFMYMAYQAPHSPLEVPRVFEKLYKRAIRNQDRRKYAGRFRFGLDIHSSENNTCVSRICIRSSNNTNHENNRNYEMMVRLIILFITMTLIVVLIMMMMMMIIITIIIIIIIIIL